MSLSPKALRELRRWLRASADNLLDVADTLSANDREQQLRLRNLAREIEIEIGKLDRKINAALANRQ